MNAHVKELFEEARKLSAEERIELADLLYADLPVSSEWEAAWTGEARRRLEVYERGEMDAVDAQTVHEHLAEKYGLK